jgi:hypothetical protein
MRFLLVSENEIAATRARIRVQDIRVIQKISHIVLHTRSKIPVLAEPPAVARKYPVTYLPHTTNIRPPFQCMYGSAKYSAIALPCI